MQSKLSETIPKLQQLKKYLSERQWSRIYLLCGNEKAGKNTLAHYIIEADINYEVDQEGQDVLTIQNQSETVTIVDGVLELMPCADQDVIFVKLVGFVGGNQTQELKEEYALSLDYLLTLLTHATNTSIKFILILSLLQLQQDDEIFSKYYNCFKSVPDFVNRSHIVLSKLVDQDEFNQFVEMTSQDIIQSKENCEYINQIIQEERIYGFYSRDVDPDQRYQFNQKINGTDVGEKFNVEENDNLIRKVMHELGQDLHNIAEQYYTQLKSCFHILNTSFIQLLYAGCKIDNDPQLLKIKKENYKKLYGKEGHTEYIKTIGQKKVFEEYVHFYEKLFNIAKTTPQQLIPTFLPKLTYLATLFTEELEESNFITRIQILVLVCNAVSEKGSFLFLRTEEFFSLFTNHENGAFQDHYLAKAFTKIKPFLSPEFSKAHQNLSSSSAPKKKPLKKKPKNQIPSYQQQKKNYLSKPRKLPQILQLLPSPLKIDLLLEELQKMRKNKSRAILDEKALIRDILRLLDVYGCYEEAVRVSWVVPDFYAMGKFGVKLIEGFQSVSADIPEKDGKLISQICQFFSSVNRIQYILKIQQSLLSLQSHLSQSNPNPHPTTIPKLLHQISTLKSLSLSLSLSLSQQPQQNRMQPIGHFMNYSRISELVSQNSRKKLVEKFVQFQDMFPGRVYLEIVEEWVGKGADIKVV